VRRGRPELLDKQAIPVAWKGGGELAEATQVIGYALSLGEFEEAVPDHLMRWVRDALRLNPTAAP